MKTRLVTRDQKKVHTYNTKAFQENISNNNATCLAELENQHKYIMSRNLLSFFLNIYGKALHKKKICQQAFIPRPLCFEV